MQLPERYARDQKIWDACAQSYEAAIVHGHPDVTAYENFEEDLLDRLLLFLTRDKRQALQLYDVGCGSGRLHLRYGLQALPPSSLDHNSAALNLQALRPGFQHVPEIAAGLRQVGGLDFSENMLMLARNKLEQAGLLNLPGLQMHLEQGSAFDLQPFPAAPLPVVVTLCNSIGVMQGPEGAQKLFQAMRRTVEAAGGIAIISAYCREAIADFALNNYESTMDASGQPCWLQPTTYAGAQWRQKPHRYKRAYDRDDQIMVDVYNDAGQLEQSGHKLQRDPAAVARTVETGHIQTHHHYESRWYGTDVFRKWINQYWPEDRAWHIAGSSLDAPRATPVQLAVLDAGNRLAPFFKRLHLQDRFIK